eukprot:1916074-Pyramimonas_sp.AAC.3
MVNSQAVAAAKKAVEHDTAGRWSEAITSYEEAATIILGDNPSEADRYEFHLGLPSQLRILCVIAHMLVSDVTSNKELRVHYPRYTTATICSDISDAIV